MIMSKETILGLYKEALDNGDPVKQIKSLAKANGVKATLIKAILSDAGYEVPDHIPTGPLKKEETLDEEVPEEAEEEVPAPELPLPDAVKEALAEKLDSIDGDIKRYQERIRMLEIKYTTIAKYINNR